MLSYLLVYRPDTSPPSIAGFVHTARDLAPLLADPRDPPGRSGRLALLPDGRPGEPGCLARLER